MAARKLEEKRRTELAREFAAWEERARQAQERGDRDAARKALARCDEIADADASAKVQIRKIDEELRLAEKQLKEIAVKGEQRVDPDALLASLERATGPVDPQKREMEEIEKRHSVEEELSRLKERLKGES